MLQGTSMVSSQAAGAGALLVSAAKQAGVHSKPVQLCQAVLGAGGRPGVLLGNVRVAIDGNVLVGSGDVVVQSVNP